MPTNTLSLAVAQPAGSAFLNGNTVYYRGTAAGNFQLQNAVSDAGSGPASAIFPRSAAPSAAGHTPPRP